MESCRCVNSSPLRREKRWKKKDTEQEEDEFVVLCVPAVVLRRTEKVVFKNAHEDKEINENVDAPAKKKKEISTNSVVAAIFDELSGSRWLPAYDKPT